MKRTLNTIITALGAVCLFAVVAPVEADAQQRRGSASYDSNRGREYVPTRTQARGKVAPVRRSSKYQKKSRASKQRYVRTARKATRYRTINRCYRR